MGKTIESEDEVEMSSGKRLLFRWRALVVCSLPDGRKVFEAVTWRKERGDHDCAIAPPMLVSTKTSLLNPQNTTVALFNGSH